MESIAPFFTTLLVRSPQFLIWLAGIIIAFSRYDKHPRRSLYALIGFGILFFTGLLGAYTAVLPIQMMNRGMSTAQMGVWFSVFGIGQAIFSAIGSGFILAAIFATEQDKPQVDIDDNS